VVIKKENETIDGKDNLSHHLQQNMKAWDTDAVRPMFRSGFPIDKTNL